MNIFSIFQQIIRMFRNECDEFFCEYSLWISSEKRRMKTHGRVYRFFNHKANFIKQANALARFVDYTSITCRFSIPIRLPEIGYVNIIIYNRDNHTSKTSTPAENISLQDILQLIEFNKKFHNEPILPSYSAIASSPTTTDDFNVMNDDDGDDAPTSPDNIVVLDEKLL